MNWKSVNYKLTDEEFDMLEHSYVSNIDKDTLSETYWFENNIEIYILKGDDNKFHAMKCKRDDTESYRDESTIIEVGSGNTIQSIIKLIQNILF